VSESAFDTLCTEGFFLHTAALAGLPYRYGLARLPPPARGPIDAVILRAPFVDQFTALVARPVVY
jgi:hypothetical protein